MGPAVSARKFVEDVYRLVTLFAGYVVFDKIRVLQAHEFDCEAVFNMPYDAALRPADRYDDANGRTQVGSDAYCGTGLREVDHTASDIRAIWQDQPRHRLSRRKALMASIFRQVENLPVCQPGKLRRELVTLAQGCRNGHGETILEDPRDLAFQPAEMIDVGDHPLTRLPRDRRDQGHAAGRHVNDLARKLAPVGQHVAAQEVYLDALMAPAFLGERQNHRFGQRQRHRLRSEGVSATVEPISLSLTMG